MNYATTNGCICHMIQTPGEPFKKCISCRARAECTVTCSQCGVGIHLAEKEDNNGLCSECYYGEYI